MIATLIHFFYPTRIKLLFLLEWVLLVLLEWVSGKIVSLHHLAIAIYPLAFFYLAGSGLVFLSERLTRPPKLAALLALVTVLAALDQAAKWWVVEFLPLGRRVLLVRGAFSLERADNLAASWALNRLGLDSVGIGWLISLSIVFLVGALFGYRYYLVTRGESFWAAASFLFLGSGVLSALVDQVGRGFTVDYLSVHGFVVADLKDVYLTFGIAAILAETLCTPPDLQAGSEESQEDSGFLTFMKDEWRRLKRQIFQKESPGRDQH